MSFSIIGTGHAVPEKIITNDWLAERMDTSDEWIFSRTGIKERRLSVLETATSLSLDAALQAIGDANIDKNDIDLIICATMRGDYITPSQACIIQKELGVSCPAFDINAACSGFVYALDVARGYFAAKRVKKVLIVAVEMLSRVINWEDRSTCVLFGDGAGAAILSEGDDLLTSFITAQGNIEGLNITYPFGKSIFGAEVEERDGFVHMNGKSVYAFTVNAVSNDLQRCLAESGLSPEELSWVIPHQANVRIINSAAAKSGIAREKFYVNIDKYANTSCASIPMALDEMAKSNMLKKDDTIAMAGFGGGFTTGVCVIRWCKG